MFDGKIHVNIDGKDIALTPEQEASIRTQLRAIDGYNLLEQYECRNLNKLSMETLSEIQLSVEDAIYDLTDGEIESSVLSYYVDDGILDIEDLKND